MRKLPVVAAIAAGIAALAVCGGSLWLASFAMTGERQTLDEAMAWQSAHYDTSFYDELQKVDYTVDAPDGYVLHAQELRNPVSTNKYVILSHGYTDNRMGSLKYVPLYLDLGYNCVIYDLRGHGLNKPTFTTYGMRESADLACVADDVRVRHPELTQLGLHGESLGAATTVSALGLAPAVDFAVADCGFASIEGVLRDGYANAGAPVFLVDLADLGARVRYGYAIKDMRPIDALDQNTVPVLFVHGQDDNLISPQNSQDMYERTPGERELWLVPGAGHAESVLVAPEEYHEHVREFLSKL
ncbi:MAG: alpha/beta hydrolase [Coriobacteriales bacterium]|nr:alpha/beta hydrolase [Coriobacteriales bacterium]